MKTIGQMVYLVHIAICLPHTDLLGKARGVMVSFKWYWKENNRKAAI